MLMMNDNFSSTSSYRPTELDLAIISTALVNLERQCKETNPSLRKRTSAILKRLMDVSDGQTLTHIDLERLNQMCQSIADEI